MKTFIQWLNEETLNKKNIFVLVGPPSVGKSTWIKNNFTEKPYVINRDDIVDQVSSSLGLTYDDMFMAPPKDAQLGDSDPKYGTVVKSPAFMHWQPLSYSKILEGNKIINDQLKQKFENAIHADSDIVVDMTNMNAQSRKNALNAVKGHEDKYRKIAVVFPFQGAEDIIKKNAAIRAAKIKSTGGSKTIPDAAFDRMFSSFQHVDSSEGFDEITEVDNRDTLKKLIP